MQSNQLTELKMILNKAQERQASDIHLSEDMNVVFRIFGVLKREDAIKVTHDELKQWYEYILNEAEKKLLNENGQIDVGYEDDKKQRYRINIFYACRKINFVIRVIMTELPRDRAKYFPEVIWKMAAKSAGMVIVAGRTGSGKSTTLSMMVDWINQHFARHIITLEDPVEYRHLNKLSIIEQREYRKDFASLDNAVYAALREDPDVVLIGEMRDAVAIKAALTAAETGHLVLTTLHTGNSEQAIERLITAFPAGQQEQIRFQISQVLQGIIIQQLLPVEDKGDRTAVMEIMTATPAVRSMIREQKLHQLNSQLETGARWGMQTVNQSIKKLSEQGINIKKSFVEQYDDFLN